jgi:glycosyltransferase involved in cell wall biosynthesis
MTLVSIVVPCYNLGAYVEEAVESSLRQTYEDVEVIVVDDGSPDPETQRVLDRLEGPRTRVLRKKNGGCPSALNAGVTAARGEFVLPLSADDRLGPDYVRQAVEVLRSRDELGIVYCRAELFDGRSGPWDLPDFSPDEMARGNVIFASAMFRRADWELVGGFNEDAVLGLEDWDFWLRLIALPRDVLRLDDVLFHYRIRRDSLTVELTRDPLRTARAQAVVFQNNIEFFADHAVAWFAYRNELESEVWQLRTEVRRWRWLTRRLDSYGRRHPRIARAASRALLRR